MSSTRIPPGFEVMFRVLSNAIQSKSAVRVSAAHLFGKPQSRTVEGTAVAIVQGADGRDRLVMRLAGGDDDIEVRIPLDRIESAEAIRPGETANGLSQVVNQDRIETRPARAVSLPTSDPTSPTRRFRPVVPRRDS